MENTITDKTLRLILKRKNITITERDDRMIKDNKRKSIIRYGNTSW